MSEQQPVVEIRNVTKTFAHGNLYPDDFTGEQLCKYSLWQSWTFKPAVANTDE